MPLITLPFNFDINVSIQVGDMAYFVPTTTSASFDINSSAVIQIGPVTAINSTSMPRTITCNTNLVLGTPP